MLRFLKFSFFIFTVFLILIAILPFFIDKQKIASLVEDRLKNDFKINEVLELILIRIQYRGLEVPELKKLISKRGINAADCTLKDDFIQLLEKYDRENVFS